MNDGDLSADLTIDGDIGLFEFQIKRGVVNLDDIEEGDSDLGDLVSQLIALCDSGNHDQAAAVLLPRLFFEFDPSQMDDEPSEFFSRIDPVEFECTPENCHVRIGTRGGLAVTIAVTFEIPLRSGITLDDIKRYISQGGAWAAGHVSPGWTYAESDGDNVWFIGVKGRVSVQDNSDELFRLDEDAEEDLDDAEGEGAENLTVDVYTRDIDAALAAFKAAVEAGAINVRISSNEAWGTGVFESVNLSFEAVPGSDVVSLVKRAPFVRDSSDLDGDADEPDTEEDFLEEDEPDDWREDEPDEDGLEEQEEGGTHPAPSSVISLVKGQNLSLSKTDPGLKKIIIGLGWDPRATDGQEFDLDASLFMLGENGKVRSDADFIFYNQKMSGCGSVEHTGDNQTGAGDGDDEQVKVDLSRVPANVQRLAVAVTIHDADARRQSFGQVSNAFIRVLNEDSGAEVVRYDLSEDYSTETAMIFGEVYRHNGEWKFKAVGQGYAGGLGAMCTQFGIVV